MVVIPGHPFPDDVHNGPRAQNSHGPNGWESSKTQGENRVNIPICISIARVLIAPSSHTLFRTRAKFNTERWRTIGEDPITPSPA